MKHKFLIILIIELIAINKCVYSAAVVTNLTSSTQTQTSIQVDWINPDTDFDNLKLTYSILDDNNKTLNVNLTKNVVTSYTISTLKPGTTLLISISTIKNNSVIAVSEQITVISELDFVKQVYNLTADSYTISGKFQLPDGYFDVIAYECQSILNEDIKYEGVISPGSNYFICLNLQPGYNYTIIFVTLKQDYYAISDYFYTKTGLDRAQINPEEVTSGTLNLNLAVPEGNYDYIQIQIDLISTNAFSYFLNKSLVTNCNSGNVKLVKYERNQTIDLSVTDLCMLSIYNITVTTVEDGFNTVAVSKTLKTNYGNIDCSTLDLITIDNETTVTWSKPNIILKNYTVTISDSKNALSTESLFVRKNETSTKFYDLQFEYDYSFTFVTNALVKGVNQKLTETSSMNCSKILKTGPPCPTITGIAILNYAPYVYNVSISISSDIFTSTSLIDYIDIYVGEQTDCESNYKNSKCYKALKFTMADLLTSSILSFNLSTDSVCNKTSSYCNKQFSLDRKYYVSLRAYSICGGTSSSSLEILIPSPFPLGATIAIIISLSIGLIVVLLTIVMALTYIHIRNKHIEEIEYLLSSQSFKENGADSITVF